LHDILSVARWLNAVSATYLLVLGLLGVLVFIGAILPEQPGILLGTTVGPL